MELSAKTHQDWLGKPISTLRAPDWVVRMRRNSHCSRHWNKRLELGKQPICRCETGAAMAERRKRASRRRKFSLGKSALNFTCTHSDELVTLGCIVL